MDQKTKEAIGHLQIIRTWNEVGAAYAYDEQDKKEKRKTVHWVDDALAILNEKEEIVKLRPVAKFLAKYATPPIKSPLSTYGSCEKAWEAVLRLASEDEHYNKDTCSDCRRFIGGGDWNLCCQGKHDLCYRDTPACDEFDSRWKLDESPNGKEKNPSSR